MPLVFGFDLGTKTGFALHDGKRVSIARTLNFTRKAGVSWSRVRSEFLDLVVPDSRSIIVYEEVRRHLGTTAAHIYGGFLAMLKCVAEEHAVECVGVGVGVLKKFATGRGDATKRQMVTSCMARLGVNPKDDNAADAAWLAEYGAMLLRERDV